MKISIATLVIFCAASAFVCTASADDMKDMAGMDMRVGSKAEEAAHAKPGIKSEEKAISDEMMEQMTTMEAGEDHDMHMNMGPGGMAAMNLHMRWTGVRQSNPADQQRATELLTKLRESLA